MKSTLLFLFMLATLAGVTAQKITAVDSVIVNGKPIVFNYSGGTGAATDWIGIYQRDTVPDGSPASCFWDYIPSASGTYTFNAPYKNASKNLVAGKYTAHLFCCDGYKILASCNIEITGAIPAKIETLAFAIQDSNFTFKYSGGTGSPTDWVGLYKKGDTPGVQNSLVYEYIPAKEGEITFKKTGLKAGNYTAFLLCCDGYDVLSKVDFTIFENLKPSLAPVGDLIAGKPLKFKFTGGTGSLLDWVGFYPKDTIPDGTPPSVYYLYVNGVNGELEFPATALKAGVSYDAHLFCCDDYKILASYKNFTLKTSTGANELTVPQLKVFTISPNPSFAVVNIRFSKEVTGQFNFYNMLGQSVKRLKINKDREVKVTDLVKGSYIGIFQSTEGSQSQKIIIQ